MHFSKLNDANRLLFEVDLEPIQGTRFQPTGFPDLGAAEYETPDDTSMLLLESAQSMANRLEEVCWDDGQGELVEPLRGMPYVHSQVEDDVETNSILEAHRLNSPYIYNSEAFGDDGEIEQAIGFEDDAPFDRSQLADALLTYDPNSLVHGCFLEKVGGTVRLPRTLSAFIEAEEVRRADSGGVKVDRVQPASSGNEAKYGSAEDGYGNVPYPRTEYTAESITAYFNLDLSLICGLGLPEAGEDLLVGLALFKVRKFLDGGLRLRTACDLTTTDDDAIEMQRPANFEIPSLDDISEQVSSLVDECAPHFADPAVTEVSYDG